MLIWRKYFSQTGYSTPSGHAILMKINPPKSAEVKKNEIHRTRPMGPPRRGSDTAASSLGTPGMVGVVFPGFTAGTVVVTSTAEVKLYEPALVSGNVHVTVQLPFVRRCVRAAETVSPSAANWGALRLMMRLSHVSTRPIWATASAPPTGAVNRN